MVSNFPYVLFFSAKTPNSLFPFILARRATLLRTFSIPSFLSFFLPSLSVSVCFGSGQLADGICSLSVVQTTQSLANLFANTKVRRDGGRKEGRERGEHEEEDGAKGAGMCQEHGVTDRSGFRPRPYSNALSFPRRSHAKQADRRLLHRKYDPIPCKGIKLNPLIIIPGLPANRGCGE